MLSDQDIEDLHALAASGGVRRDLIELLIHHDFASQAEATSFYWFNIIGALVAVGLVVLGSGLFLGLMTLDAFDLKIIMRSSLDEDERMYAAALLPIVKQRHLLLVTLLIVDAVAYETLPLFLDKLMPGWVVILLSTTLVMLFGEIVPSAICMGPQQLELGYYMVPIVKVLLIVLYPITMPCSMLLDYLVHGPEGEDHTQEEYNRGELSALVKIQYEQRHVEVGSRGKSLDKKFSARRALTQWGALKQEMLQAVNERYERTQKDDHEDDDSPLEREIVAPMEKQEVDVVVGALQMKTKVASDVYTPRRKVYCIADDLVLDRDVMTNIYAEGFSRVPVFQNMEGRDMDTNRSCVIGFLMTRQLMLIDWDHEREVSTLPLVRPDCVSPRSNLVYLLKLLRSGGSLMAFVCARPDLANRALQAELPIPVEAGFMGIITLEDILESILQERIYDEWDIKERDRAVNTLRRWAALKLQSFARKSVAKRRGSVSPSRKRQKGSQLVKDILSEKTPLIKKKAVVMKRDTRNGRSRYGSDSYV